MKMSNFWLDIRWWIFCILILVQFSDCVKHQKTFVNENAPVVDDDGRTIEIGCPVKCLCLGDLADCSKNDLMRIPNRIPSWANELDLSQNQFTEFDVEQDVQDLTNIRKLNLNKNRLTKFPILHGLSELETLKIEQNQLEVIPAEALLALPKLTVLILNKNGIKSVLPNTFPSNNRLKTLHLNNNNIKHLQDSSFNLKELTELKLNHNKLTTLSLGIFKNLKRLIRLELNGNKLTDVPYGVFQNLTNLRVLKLRNNSIANLTIGAFFGLRHLGTLELDGNHITKLDKSAFFHLTKLRTLTVTNNHITHIEPHAFEFCSRLNNLDLGSNELSTITAATFEPLSHIQHLSLSNNKITWIGEGTFQTLSTLEWLDLSNNQIFQIIEDANAPFNGLNRLSRFELQRNGIKSIHFNVFSGLNSLTYLDLTMNNISNIQAGAFDKLDMLKDLLVNTTNLFCDCNLRWFHQFLINGQYKDVEVGCAYPIQLAGKSLSALMDEELTCNETPNPRIIEEPLSQLAVKGTNVTLNCTAIASSSSAMVFKWKRDNFELSPRQILTKSVVQPLTNNTMATSQLVMIDVSHENAGKYQCIVSNIYGTSYSPKIKIGVASFPEFRKIPSNVTVDSGSTVRLDCAASVDSQIAWQKDGGNDFPAARERRMHVMPKDDAFFIVNAKISDQGVYTCTAENPAGIIKANATLTVQETPSFVKPMENKEVSCGKTAVIECMASGSPKPGIVWLKDDKQIEATERHFFAADDQLLIIVGTELSDSGTYTCQMENKVGSDFGHMKLKVKPIVGTNVVNIDEMTGIVIITGVCVGTSIIWVVIIYQTKKGGLCSSKRRSSVPETVENTTTTGTSTVVRHFPVYVSVNDNSKNGGYGATSHSFSYEELGHIASMRDGAQKHEETNALINQNPIISRRVVPRAIGENFETDDSEEESVLNPSSLSDDRSGNTVTNEMASIHSCGNAVKNSPINCTVDEFCSVISADVEESTDGRFVDTVIDLHKQQPVVRKLVECIGDV